jgi:flavin reductase (DIM6/NTAB) family NADH-FMN oxidoreductase RutF
VADPGPPDPRRELARALGRVPSGLFVVSAGGGGEVLGVLASWVQQAGFAPPALTVALRAGRAILERIRADGTFCVSILRDDDRANLARFARGDEAGAFAGAKTAIAGNGVPYLADSHAMLACRLRGEAAWSDHVIVCGEVLEGRRHDDASPRVHVRENGLSY